MIGGPETPGIGFAFSIERLFRPWKLKKWSSRSIRASIALLSPLGEEAKAYGVKLLHQLREAGISSEKDYLDRKVKGQFKAADRHQAKYVAVIGDNELTGKQNQS